jgi:KDO2-lipid IV(A) lauroyltransferase
VNFFGIPTKTNPATARFAKMTGALVIPYVLFRKPDNNGYLMQVDAPLANYPTGDMSADAQRINDRIQDWARLEPSQYNWMHRRFKDKTVHPALYD